LKEEKNFLLPSEEFDALIGDALEGIFDACDNMRRGLIQIAPRDPSDTCNFTHCDFFDICRYAL